MAEHSPCYRRQSAFTLAELLIALVILGVIATFTIPKVLTAQQNSQRIAKTKEVVAMISGAYQAYQQQNQSNGATSEAMLTPYMNYVSVDTTASLIDHEATLSSLACNFLGGGCLLLHNGGKLKYQSDQFNSTAATSAIPFIFDPDGVYSGAINPPENKSVPIWLYIGGRITTAGGLDANTCDVWACYSPNSALDPPWIQQWN